MGKSDICINKTKIEKFLLDKIKELEGYTYSDEYDEVEKHDCRVASNSYKEILSFLNEEGNNYVTCTLNGADEYKVSMDILFACFSKCYQLKVSADILVVMKDIEFKLNGFPINGAKCQEFNTIEECIAHTTMRFLDKHNYPLNKVYELSGETLWKNLMYKER